MIQAVKFRHTRIGIGFIIAEFFFRLSLFVTGGDEIIPFVEFFHGGVFDGLGLHRNDYASLLCTRVHWFGKWDFKVFAGLAFTGVYKPLCHRRWCRQRASRRFDLRERLGCRGKDGDIGKLAGDERSFLVVFKSGEGVAEGVRLERFHASHALFGVELGAVFCAAGTVA